MASISRYVLDIVKTPIDGMDALQVYEVAGAHITVASYLKKKIQEMPETKKLLIWPSLLQLAALPLQLYRKTAHRPLLSYRSVKLPAYAEETFSLGARLLWPLIDNLSFYLAELKEQKCIEPKIMRDLIDEIHLLIREVLSWDIDEIRDANMQMELLALRVLLFDTGESIYLEEMAQLHRSVGIEITEMTIQDELLMNNGRRILYLNQVLVNLMTEKSELTSQKRSIISMGMDILRHYGQRMPGYVIFQASIDLTEIEWNRLKVAPNAN